VLALVPVLADDASKARKRNRLLAFSAVGIACVAGAGYLFWALKLWKSLI
jgi:hypothetical protein